MSYMLVACQRSVLASHISLMCIGRRGSDVSIGEKKTKKKHHDLEQPQLLGSTNPPITMVLYPLELLPFWGTQLKLDKFNKYFWIFSLQLFLWCSFCKKQTTTKKYPTELNHCHSSKDLSWHQLIFYTDKSNDGMWFYLFIFVIASRHSASKGGIMCDTTLCFCVIFSSHTVRSSKILHSFLDLSLLHCKLLLTAF